MEELTFEGSGGTLLLRRLGHRFVQQILSKPEMPPVPTYDAPTVSGHVEKHPHNETTLETEAEKAAWYDYQAARERVTSERWDNLLDFLFSEAIQSKPPPTSEWSINLEKWGLEAPDDPEKLKRFWLENIVCPGEEMGSLIARLFQLAGLADDEGVRQFEAFFRITLSRLTLGGTRGLTAK